MERPDLITVREAAEIAGVAEGTLSATLKRPDAPPYFVYGSGNWRLLDRIAFMEWLTRHPPRLGRMGPGGVWPSRNAKPRKKRGPNRPFW